MVSTPATPSRRSERSTRAPEFYVASPASLSGEAPTEATARRRAAGRKSPNQLSAADTVRAATAAKAAKAAKAAQPAHPSASPASRGAVVGRGKAGEHSAAEDTLRSTSTGPLEQVCT